MKIKFIAAAALALCSSASFAAAAKISCIETATTSGSVTIPAHVNIVNTCAPSQVLYVAGSSALGSAISGAVSTLFKPDTMITVTDSSGLFNASNTVAYFGKSAATDKYISVIYNKNNGSAAGVNQVMVKIGKTAALSLPEANVVKPGALSATAANTCADTTASTTAPKSVSCASIGVVQADLAITDVAPNELYKLDPLAAKTKFSALTNKVLGLQGFGIAVNWNFYQALQTQNLADKLIPSTCVAGDITAACQPTIRRADYSTLVTRNAVTKGASIFIPGSTEKLVLARRDDLSGTQATSNIYFGNGACGVAPGTSTSLGGAMAFVSADNTPATTLLEVRDLAVSSDVTTALTASTGYSIGMVALSSSKNIAANTWNFVKIDGQSPNYLPDGTPAYKGRTAFANGFYPIAVTSYATYHTANMAKLTDKLTMINTLVTGMADSAKSDLSGVAYLDGKEDTDAAKPKQSKYMRGTDNGSRKDKAGVLLAGTANNNCSPLIRK
jgi:hypothetical protein